MGKINKSWDKERAKKVIEFVKDHGSKYSFKNKLRDVQKTN